MKTTETGRAYFSPNDPNLSKMSTGVTIGWYATIITAPNSLNPRANIMINPDKMFFQASGTEIVKNTRIGEAPRFKAVFSSRTGTFSKPSRAAFIKKGILTKAIARAIPTGCPTKLIPTTEAAFPKAESLEMNPKMAIPAAVCGITIGRSIIPLINFLNLKWDRAKKKDKGIAPIAKNNVDKKDTRKVSHILFTTSGSFDVSNSCKGVVAKNMLSSGLIIKSKISPPSNNTIKSKYLSLFLYIIIVR